MCYHQSHVISLGFCVYCLLFCVERYEVCLRLGHSLWLRPKALPHAASSCQINPTFSSTTYCHAFSCKHPENTQRRRCHLPPYLPRNLHFSSSNTCFIFDRKGEGWGPVALNKISIKVLLISAPFQSLLSPRVIDYLLSAKGN